VTIHEHTYQTRPRFDDFRDVIHAASEHLKELQRDGQNVTLFESLVRLLPDPNNPALWNDSTLLDTVRNHLCEQNEDHTYRYAMIPIVAVGVAAQYARTRKEFTSVAGLHATAYWSKIRDDLFYWNHFNAKRQGLKKYRLSLRWAWHVLQGNLMTASVKMIAQTDFGKEDSREVANDYSINSNSLS
jgi:hypothetical protein